MKHLKFLLRSLVKNNACVEGGRTYPWWVAVIFFILSTIISLIPTAVSALTLDGGLMITQNAYDTDKGIYEVLQQMEDDGIDLKFYNENTVEGFDKEETAYAKLTGEWKRKDGDNNIPYVVTETVSVYTSATEDTEASIETKINVPIFKLYVFDDADSETLLTKRNIILQGGNPYVDDLQTNGTNTNNTSFMLFGKTDFYFAKYVAFQKPSDETGNVVPYEYRGTYRDISEVSSLLELKEATLTETVSKTALFLNQAFNQIKLENAAIQLAIYLAINAGIVLLMGFVLWLMTRGKNNPFRCYKIIETMKIACWTSFTPAILSMIFGFILGASNSMAGFMFLLLFGIRSMWLAMKNLRPNNTTPAQK